MECVFKAREHIDCIWSAIEEISIDSPSTKDKFVLTMLFVAFNHCDGIQTLVIKKNFAFSLKLSMDARVQEDGDVISGRMKIAEEACWRKCPAG